MLLLGPIGDEIRSAQIKAFVEQGIPVRDFMLQCLEKEKYPTDLAAIEIYIKRIYQSHLIKNIAGGTLEVNHLRNDNIVPLPPTQQQVLKFVFLFITIQLIIGSNCFDQ